MGLWKEGGGYFGCTHRATTHQLRGKGQLELGRPVVRHLKSLVLLGCKERHKLAEIIRRITRCLGGVLSRFVWLIGGPGGGGKGP